MVLGEQCSWAVMEGNDAVTAFDSNARAAAILRLAGDAEPIICDLPFCCDSSIEVVKKAIADAMLMGVFTSVELTGIRAFGVSLDLSTFGSTFCLFVRLGARGGLRLRSATADAACDWAKSIMLSVGKVDCVVPFCACINAFPTPMIMPLLPKPEFSSPSNLRN